MIFVENIRILWIFVPLYMWQQHVAKTMFQRKRNNNNKRIEMMCEPTESNKILKINTINNNNNNYKFSKHKITKKVDLQHMVLLLLYVNNTTTVSWLSMTI